jgi:hypothetical protein
VIRDRFPRAFPLALSALALVASLLAPVPSTAQQTAKVIATCGSASYTAGTTNYVTQDTTGAACGNGGGGGGSTNATIVAPLGTGSAATGVRTTLDSTDAAALQSIITNTGAATPAGSAIIGKVGIDQTTPGTTNLVVMTQTGANVTVTPTIQNASYVSGNCMGGFQTVSLGSLQSVLNQTMLSSKAGLVTAKQVYEFGANPTGSTCTDKGTFTLASADVPKLLTAPFQITPATATGATATSGAQTSQGLGIPAGGVIYVAIVETTTETPATTSDLVLGFSAF